LKNLENLIISNSLRLHWFLS